MESAAALNAAQPSSFTLATLNFTGVGGGLGIVSIAGGSVSDETGALSLPFSTVDGQIRVTPIPEVGTSIMGLLLVGLLGLQWFRR